MSRGRPHGMPMGMSSVSMPESEPMLCGIPVYKIEEVLLNNQEEIKLFGLSAENILTFFEYYKMKNGSSHITLDSIVEAFEGGENPSIKIKSLGTQHDKL